jgi:predicted small secreted protein
MVTVGGIIGGGLRLVRDRPISTLIWGIIYMAATAAGMVTVFLPFMQMTMTAQQSAPDPTILFRAMGVMYLFYFGLFIVLTVLMAAGVRAVLRPDEPGFAYIRLGMDELRLVGLMLLLVIGSFILMIVLVILMSIVLAATGAMGGFGRGGAPGLGFFLMMIVIYAIPIFFYVRLSPALALTMIRQKIIIGEAWRLTSGNFWKMFAGYLVLNLMLFAVYMAILFAIFIPLVSTMGSGGPAAIAELMQGHAGGLLPLLIGGGVVLTVLSGIGIAFWSGSITAATNELLDEPGVDYAETFA